LSSVAGRPVLGSGRLAQPDHGAAQPPAAFADLVPWRRPPGSSRCRWDLRIPGRARPTTRWRQPARWRQSGRIAISSKVLHDSQVGPAFHVKGEQVQKDRPFARKREDEVYRRPDRAQQKRRGQGGGTAAASSRGSPLRVCRIASCCAVRTIFAADVRMGQNYTAKRSKQWLQDSCGTFQRWSILAGVAVLLSLAMGMRQSLGCFNPRSSATSASRGGFLARHRLAERGLGRDPAGGRDARRPLRLAPRHAGRRCGLHRRAGLMITPPRR